MPPLLQIDNVERRFGDRTGVRLDHLELEEGETVLLRGPNGSGKTTLLRLAAGLLRPTAGTVRVLGKDPAREPEVRREIGYLGHELGLYSELTARENLEFYSRVKPRGKGEKPPGPEKIERILDRVELSEAAGIRVEAFSRGMKERLALARVMLFDSSLILLDEPTTGLDQAGIEILISYLKGRAAAGAAALVSTHDGMFQETIEAGVVRLEE
ncbi:MAG: heme ABC exporter ATP-binding protein CcmA [Candidatus Hydrogenedentota bacterium]|nr:MAG: heme ABC exporter ATP-binding protein CcmA [Candidatus Hydrogenedentota bacterium]